MAAFDDSKVLEGFLCPVCKEDLNSPENLLSHFQVNHSEDLDLLKSFKGLFGKAKKFLTQDTSPDHGSASHSRMSSTGSFDLHNKPQEMGLRTSRTELFMQLRRDRLERLTLPTNQLVIRLGKLLENMPSDPIKKKSYEQSVVAWIDESAVSRCPDCAGSFHLARRKHHCRTCGGVMCDSCSHFIQFSTIRKVLDLEPEQTESSPSNEQMRLCIHCISLLETRERKREIKDVNSRPLICQLYNLLLQSRQESDQHLSTFGAMYKSLYAGETRYNLNDAQVLRVRLIKLADTMEALTGKIIGLPPTEEDGGPGLARLKNSIRSATGHYLRINLLGIPSLPTEDQLIENQKRRKEKEMRLEEKASPTPQLENPSDVPQPSSSMVMGHGWKPSDNKKTVNESDDPLIQQMNIIRAYIKEARAANRMDEVQSLEENLKELKKEYWGNMHKHSKQGSEGSPDSSVLSLGEENNTPFN